MAEFIIGCLGTQHKPASDAMSEGGSKAGRLSVRKLRCATSVGQVEVDGNDDFGLDRLAIDGSGRVAPQRDRVHSDLREQGIAADARQVPWHAVFSDNRTDTHCSLQVLSAGFE